MEIEDISDDLLGAWSGEACRSGLVAENRKVRLSLQSMQVALSFYH